MSGGHFVADIGQQEAGKQKFQISNIQTSFYPHNMDFLARVYGYSPMNPLPT